MMFYKTTLFMFGLVLSTSAQMPPTLWQWPNSNCSQLQLPPPSTSTNAEFNGISACRGGGNSATSYACPHLMLLSPDMISAAITDGNDWAVYGVVGIGQAFDCGKCFQLEITSGTGTLPAIRKFIVQAVNTGTDVSSGQFDILVGAGGFGLFTGCSSDCQNGPVCPGGNCNVPQYSGDFRAWTPDGNCYGGGVRDPSGCEAIVGGQQTTFAENTLVYGCVEALEQNYHQNFQVNFRQVQCPNSLVRVTGIRVMNEGSVPAPSTSLNLNNQGHTTTTMDCCKSTCAWRQNVQGTTDPNWPQVFVCNREGIPLTTTSTSSQLASDGAIAVQCTNPVQGEMTTEEPSEGTTSNEEQELETTTEDPPLTDVETTTEEQEVKTTTEDPPLTESDVETTTEEQEVETTTEDPPLTESDVETTTEEPTTTDVNEQVQTGDLAGTAGAIRLSATVVVEMLLLIVAVVCL